MDLQNLKEHHEELLSFMENNGCCSTEKGSCRLLEPEFQELIDFCRMYEKKRGKKESTIRGESFNTASFLYRMQEQGVRCLDEATEEAVLSFFVSEDGLLRETRKNIQYLTQDEVRLLRAAVESSGFSARNKAVILPLLFLQHSCPAGRAPVDEGQPAPPFEGLTPLFDVSNEGTFLSIKITASEFTLASCFRR